MTKTSGGTRVGRMRPRRGPVAQGGFTLIELLIAIVILSLLLAVAVPTYKDQMRKTRRSEAQIALIEMANLEEKFFINASPPRYTATVVGTPGLGYLSNTASGNYALSVTASASAFTVKAVPVAGTSQASDSTCQEFTLTQLGIKKAKDAGGTESTDSCWRK
jgi:type IV pilus assembly protein PilE